MNKEKRRVPKLRFPGFTEDWEQRKLESLGKIITGNTPSTLKKEYWSTNSEGVVWITPTDINSVKTDWSERLLTEEGASQARIVPANSILVTCIASIGKNTINTVEAAFNQQINALVPHLSNSYFILTMLNNMESAFKRVAGTSATSIIHKTEVGQLSALLPRVEEQNKIGEIFELIDKSITLHQRKLEHLNLKKKALLQKLFPKNGERYPELRFPGFTDAWEQRKFGEIYERAGQKNDLTYGIDKIISVANMYFKKDVIVGSEEYLKTYNVFKLGDIAFEGHTNKEYRYGRFVENTIGDGIVSHIFDVFTPKINLDINFWKDLIKYEPIMGPILRRCTKASRMMSNLTTKKFLEEQILCPTLEEQKFIGEFIVSLDKNITLHQRKLEHLQLQKKALLQQMFV